MTLSRYGIGGSSNVHNLNFIFHKEVVSMTPTYDPQVTIEQLYHNTKACLSISCL
uniref:Uncharacterized protein n=1 Tax=Rhizophora mucronata TaxID=61149 RepID=A0A2P2N908_RHIMU